MADEPELVKYQSGEWVQYLQQLLAQAGYWSGAVDGEFGDELDAAVRQFQEAYGLAADGVVGPGTWAALTGGSGQSSSEDPDERQVLINRDDFPELFYLLSFNDFEEWARDIGLDVEWLQSDDDELVS